MDTTYSRGKNDTLRKVLLFLQVCACVGWGGCMFVCVCCLFAGVRVIVLALVDLGALLLLSMPSLVSNGVLLRHAPRTRVTEFTM